MTIFAERNHISLQACSPFFLGCSLKGFLPLRASVNNERQTVSESFLSFTRLQWECKGNWKLMKICLIYFAFISILFQIAAYFKAS
jgi:hypothetical protein